MIQPRPPVRFEGTPVGIRTHSPEVGQHTVDILSELGLTLDEMRAMAEEGAIA